MYMLYRFVFVGKTIYIVINHLNELSKQFIFFDINKRITHIIKRL